jgi:hypothetical protein
MRPLGPSRTAATTSMKVLAMAEEHDPSLVRATWTADRESAAQSRRSHAGGAHVLCSAPLPCARANMRAVRMCWCEDADGGVDVGAPIEVRSPLITVRQSATDAATETHRAPAGTLLFVVPTFELRGAGGITFWVVIRASDNRPVSESAPYPLSNGGSINPFTLPFLAPGSYRVCLDARDIPVGAPVVERRRVADWSLVITQPERWI